MATLSPPAHPVGITRVHRTSHKVIASSLMPANRDVGIVTGACDRGAEKELRTTVSLSTTALGEEITGSSNTGRPGEGGRPPLAVKENSVADDA